VSTQTRITTALGFDYGIARIGVAVGQTLTKTATPLKTLPARDGQPDWAVIKALLTEWRPDCLIVGLPSTADGQPHRLAAAIKRFGQRLHGRFGLPVIYIDERLSSYAAATPRGDTLDAVAARVILETWLNAPEFAQAGAA
jgi:putative holliday junction resolvase